MARGRRVSLLSVPHKQPNRHEIYAAHFLQRLWDSPAEEFERAYLTGALITLGDALGAHRYFDQAPELELVYHLRNGVAHGNRFKIDRGGQARLAKWPAYLKADFHETASFEIDVGLNGDEVLWDFIERGDIVHLLMAVSSHLNALAT